MKKKLLLIGTGLVLLLVLAVGTLLPEARRAVQEQSRMAIRDAVLRSAVQCYAVEGVYPPSLDYLEQHYALVVNHDAYIVSYEIFASNQLPNVQVLVRGEG